MLAILTTHPIQYQVPLWQALAKDAHVRFEVWYMTDHATRRTRDREFRQCFAWDIDMLSGYPHRFLELAPGASPNSFWRCRFREDFAQRLLDSDVKALWVQGWQVAAYWQAVWIAKRLGLEVWLRGESNDLAPVPPWKRGLKRFLLGQFFRRVDRFLCIGTANRRLYEKFESPKDKLYDAPYAVDNERFARQAYALRPHRSRIRRQWNISDDAFCVLFCGKFIPKKRPLDLISAAQGLLRESVTQPVHLLFTGSGELASELRSRCDVRFDTDGGVASQSSSLNTQPVRRPWASFTGFLNQTEISKAYVAADCLVLPSDYGETWGLVVNEAMASGLPCIISDRCGCALDLGTLGANAVFSFGDTAELSKSIASLAAHLGKTSTEIRLPSLTQTAALITSFGTKRLCSQQIVGAV